MAQLFRKSAIERLSSPEQLDKSIVVTSPMSWVSLIGIALIVVCFGVWAVLGSMPSTISSKGIISNGVYTNSIYSEYTGVVTEIYVNEGDKVNAGSVICSITDANNEVHKIPAKDDCIITKILTNSGKNISFADELFGISPQSADDKFVVFYTSINNLPNIHSGMEVIINLPAFDNQKYGHMTGTVVLVDDFALTSEQLQRTAGNNEEVLSYLDILSEPVAAVTCKIQSDESSSNGLTWSNEKGKSLVVNTGNIADVKIIIDESAPISRLIPGFDD